MNEPKVHLLKSGMIADKIIMILLLAVIVAGVIYGFTQKCPEGAPISTHTYYTTKSTNKNN